MIKHIYFAFIFLLGILSPLPPQIIVNPSTKECGVFWGGDEYVEYYFPPPWKELESSRVETKDGVYEWDGNWENVQTLCEKMGYKFVDGNIAEGRAIKILGPGAWMIFFFCLIPLIFVFFVIFLLSKRVMDIDYSDIIKHD